MANYWMVRSDDDWRDLVEEGGFVAIGFGGVELGNIGGLSADEIRERVEKHRPDATRNAISSNAGNLARFSREIVVGDWVLTGVNGNAVLIGLITSKYTFVGSKPNGPHQRTVTWIRKLPLNEASEQLRGSLGSQLTVFSVKPHAEEIRQLVEA